jgi:hypothetical protein
MNSMHSNALARGMLTGIVALSGLSACSRSDRADAGGDTTQASSVAVTATPSDTQSAASTTQPSTGVASRDTATLSDKQNVSGYRAMERDTSTAPVDPITASDTRSSDTAATEMRGASDSSVTTGTNKTDSVAAVSDQALTADTSIAGDSGMARDTSSMAGQGDIAGVAVADTTTAATVDTMSQVARDSANIQVQVDTTSGQTNSDTSATMGQNDTLTVTTDTAALGERGQAEGASGDTLPEANAGRVRPPEDSTEVLGSVTTDSSANSASVDVAAGRSQSDRVRPPEDSTETRGNVSAENRGQDRSSAERETSDGATGAASIGAQATGSNAVALMSRAGERCTTLNEEEDTEASWDIADSPANLNPCGPGTMTLSPVRTGEEH